jgi:hypothetical protein
MRLALAQCSDRNDEQRHLRLAEFLHPYQVNPEPPTEPGYPRGAPCPPTGFRPPPGVASLRHAPGPLSTTTFQDMPPSFLQLRVHDAEELPALRGLCCGYESEVFRNAQLASWMFNYLPDFALRFSELGAESSGVWVERLRQAAKSVYATEKFQNRGEFGELLLHAICRDLYKAEPAVSKIYYKDGPNETVKGFDCVHAVVDDGGGLELLLGEVKFYTSIQDAMTDVAKELREHFDHDDYLKAEFIAVTRKLDDAWPHTPALKALLHENTSLDQILDCVRVPVLLTYESAAVGAHKRATEEYAEAFEAEVRKIRGQFAGRKLPARVVIDLILVPLHQKADLVEALVGHLEAWKGI